MSEREQHPQAPLSACPCFLKIGEDLRRCFEVPYELPVLGFKKGKSDKWPLPVVMETSRKVVGGQPKVIRKQVILKTNTSGKKFLVVGKNLIEVNEVRKANVGIKKPVVLNGLSAEKLVNAISQDKEFAHHGKDNLLDLVKEYIREKQPKSPEKEKPNECEFNFNEEELIMLNDVNMGNGVNFEPLTNPRNITIPSVVLNNYHCTVQTPQDQLAALFGGNQEQQQLAMQIYNDYNRCLNYDSTGNMPIHHAVMENNVQQVQRQCLVLKSRGETINATNYDEYTPIQLAVQFDVDPAIIRVLLDPDNQPDTTVLDGEGNSIVHLAVTHSSEKLLRTLLGFADNTLDLDGFNYEGLTALMLCCLHRKLDHARVLVIKGADPNVRDQKSGRTALFHAIEADDYQMCRLLMSFNANPRVRNFIGTSPYDAMFELEGLPKQMVVLILGKQLPTEKNKRRRERKQAQQQQQMRQKIMDMDLDSIDTFESNGSNSNPSEREEETNEKGVADDEPVLTVKKPRFVMVPKLRTVAGGRKEREVGGGRSGGDVVEVGEEEEPVLMVKKPKFVMVPKLKVIRTIKRS